MPGPLDSLERWMEEAFEGSMQRLFRPSLQPVQLAKTAARRMEEGQQIGPSGIEVPNSYSISLNPKDFERFARYQVALQRELEKYLLKYARDHSWRPVSQLEVSLIANSSVGVGRPKVSAQMLDTALAASGGSAGAPEESIERTARHPRASLPSGTTVGRAVLLSERNERFELKQPLARLGRALENDVVVADARVSRFHAEIRSENGRFMVRDLGSTNGTLVASEQIEEAEVRDGEIISLGGYRLTFRQS